MQKLRIAVVGVGSFVFGPSILSQVILEHRLEHIELALVDIDAEIVELMAHVEQRMVRQAGVDLTISAHTEREQALREADFVTSSIVHEGYKRFYTNYQIIQRYLPGHLVTEFGGIAEISNSLRQISMIAELVADMLSYCPDAWLLNASNPLPRVCQATQTLRIHTVGFCSVSLQAYSMAWHLLNGEPLSHPFTPAREHWSITTTGLNHFGWHIDFHNRTTGEDLLPALRQALLAGKSTGNSVSEALARETGYPLLPYDDHTRDFPRPGQTVGLEYAPFHGSPLQREQRIMSGEENIETLLQNPSWERPIDVVAALKSQKPVTLHPINMVNTGQVSNLPNGIFVETPCIIAHNDLQPQQVTLSEQVLSLTLHTARVSDTIVQVA